MNKLNNVSNGCWCIGSTIQNVNYRYLRVIFHVPPKRVYIMANPADAMMEVDSGIPHITCREVPKAARMAADHKIWKKVKD